MMSEDAEKLMGRISQDPALMSLLIEAAAAHMHMVSDTTVLRLRMGPNRVVTFDDLLETARLMVEIYREVMLKGPVDQAVALTQSKLDEEHIR